MMRLGIYARSGGPVPFSLPPKADATEDDAVRFSSATVASSSPAEGSIPNDLPDGPTDTVGSGHLRHYLGDSVVVFYGLEASGWREGLRYSATPVGDTVVDTPSPRILDVSGISRDDAAYRSAIESQGVTEADVIAGQTLIVRSVSPDDNGSTSDHFIAADIGGSYGWEEYT